MGQYNPKGAKLSPVKKREVYLKVAGRCAYCGVPLSEGEFTVNHIQPRARGGSNDISNLLPACKGCSSSKGKKALEEYRFFLTYKPLWDSHGFLAAQIEWMIENLDLNKRFDFPEHKFFFELKGGIGHE